MSASALLPTDKSGTCPLQAPAHNVAHGIVSQAVLTAPGLRVTIFRFAEGQEMSEHTSTARVLVQVLAGRCAFTVEGTTHDLQPGDLLHLPPNAPHSLRAVSDLTMLLTQAAPPAA